MMVIDQCRESLRARYTRTASELIHAIGSTRTLTVSMSAKADKSIRMNSYCYAGDVRDVSATISFIFTSQQFELGSG